MSPPRTCRGCGEHPVAMRGTDHCFACWPGGPWAPPPCRICLATRGYFSDGLCARCHFYGPQKPDSCADCRAWGVYRTTGFLCYGCRRWRENAVEHGPCLTCQDIRPLGRHGVCRLCRKQASMLRRPNFDLEVFGPNRHGQQLFLANLHYRRAARPVLPEPVRFGNPAPLEPVTHRQLVLFPMTRDLAHGRERGYPPPRDPATAALLERAVAERARTHGWGRFTERTVTGAIHLLLGIQDTPGAPILASDVALLRAVRLPVGLTREVLDAAGYLEHDDTPDIAVWAERHIAHLPEQMRTEIRTWVKITVEGRSRPPRRLPKAARTLRGRLRPVLPVLEALAAGHTSLRTVTRNEIIDALPEAQNPRQVAGYAMRQILQILKEERLIFANPLANAEFPKSRNVATPEHLASIRAALTSPDPATAAVAALCAFHALPTRQIIALKITDLRGGYLHVPGGPIPLAEPARKRLAAYLDYRNARWPETANPHIFLTQRSALRTSPVGITYFSKVLGISTQRFRADRIMEEAAAGQDLRAMCDMFGITIETAQSYLALAADPDQGAAEQAHALGLR